MDIRGIKSHYAEFYPSFFCDSCMQPHIEIPSFDVDGVPVTPLEIVVYRELSTNLQSSLPQAVRVLELNFGFPGDPMSAAFTRYLWTN